MKNIRIKEIRENYYVVVADTERFGEQEVLFEGISFEECAAWIKENTKAQKKALWAVKISFKNSNEYQWICVRSKDSKTAFNRVWNMGYNNGTWFHGETEIA